jgi:precorrin-6A/cobalt-precorrin-6A reductase
MILVLGGTSDSLSICELLNNSGLEYTLSVTTKYGKDLASKYTNHILVNKMTKCDMVNFIKHNNIKLIIDATHPYAAEVSQNVINASYETKTEYIRYERKSILDDIEDPSLIKVDSIKEACEIANKIGKRIFLATGSKNINYFVENLKDKYIVARILPTSDVIKQCEDAGLNADNLIAMKGPFSEEINEILYKDYNIDLVITKESGNEGGFIEKISPCKNLDISSIIITRPKIKYPKIVNNIEDIEAFLLNRR